jgi:ParB family chromosome partitioning protein
LRQANPNTLHPHPRNSSIYGADEDVTELVEMIRQSEWVKPLVVTPSNVIISGHRRWKAVLELGLESVSVEVKEFADEMAELKALLLENASRFKTTEQKVREAQAWQDVEDFQARQRKLSTLKRKFSPRCGKFSTSGRRTRDVIASRVGLGSGRTYQKAAKVVTHSDEEANLGHQE